MAQEEDKRQVRAFSPFVWGSLFLPEELLEDRFVLGARWADGLLPECVPGAPCSGHKGVTACPGHGCHLLPYVQCDRVAAPSLHRLLGHGQRGDLLVGGCKKEQSVEGAGCQQALAAL